MKNKIKNCIKDIINLGIQDTIDDVNVDIARANYQKYQDELKEIQKNYIKTVCNKIKIASRDGCKSIKTVNSLADFMTHEFMMEMKEFQQKLVELLAKAENQDKNLKNEEIPNFYHHSRLEPPFGKVKSNVIS